ncbi:MAG: type II secretion system secretin GspD [Verrucomicrobiae bacterium]|nr:type II secretion system secretin GspD [Verrucomicrobiae bacterium]
MNSRFLWIALLTAFVGNGLLTPLVKSAPAGPDDKVTINFPNATVDQIIALYADLTGRTAIRPSTLTGRIVLQANGPLSKEDAIIALENVLSINGFSVVRQGEKFFKVVLSKDVTREGVAVSAGDDKLLPADQVASRVFQLKFVEVKDVQDSLKPVIHTYGQITPFPRTNSILITDTAANLIEIGKIIDHLDRPLEAKVKTKFYQLKNAKAKDVVARILELLGSTGVTQQGQKPATPGAPPAAPGAEGQAAAAAAKGGELTFSEEAIVVGKVSISADERTNQIILLTRGVNFPFFDQMIERLDADSAAPAILKSIALKYAEAEDLAGLINQVLGRGGASSRAKKDRLTRDTAGSPYSASPQRGSSAGSTSPSSSGLSSASGTKVNKFGEDLVVYADPRTNSLIVMGTESDIAWVQDFVKDVDVLLAQVLLEGIVVEVSLDREDSLGVDVLARASSGQLANAGLVKGLTINPLDAATISSAAALPTGLPAGLSYFASLKNSKVDILVQALAQNSRVKILSQPIIQTSHNEEAKIVVAEARPIVTSTATDLVGNQGNLRSNYEYKDIGIQLTIRPLVNPDGLVVLDILQRVDNITSFQVIDNNQVPVIARREASSIVSVQDGSMVILGGLIENKETVTRSGVPILSDIPVLGYLFGSTDKKGTRTELMVMLKPTVLRTAEAASAEATLRRRSLELFKKQGLQDKILSRKNLSEQIDAIERPKSIPAKPAQIRE